MKTRCGKDCPNVKMTQEETLQHNPKGWEMVEVSPGCFVSALLWNRMRPADAAKADNTIVLKHWNGRSA